MGIISSYSRLVKLQFTCSLCAVSSSSICISCLVARCCSISTSSAAALMLASLSFCLASCSSALGIKLLSSGPTANRQNRPSDFVPYPVVQRAAHLLSTGWTPQAMHISGEEPLEGKKPEAIGKLMLWIPSSGIKMAYIGLRSIAHIT